MTTRRTLAAILLAVIAATSGGCDALNRALGTPTHAEWTQAQRDIDAARRQVDDLEYLELEATSKEAAARAQAEATEARKVDVRKVMAAMASQLANLDGAAADAVVDSIAVAQRNLQAIDDEAAQWAAQAAAYQAALAELAVEQIRAADELDDAKAQLAGFADRRAAAIAGAQAAVTASADTAASFGVPGAREVAEKLGGALNIGLNLLLGSGAVAGGVVATRQRRRRLNLGKAVAATEKFDLLEGASETAREGAKEFAGPAAHLELKRTLAENGHT